MTEVMCTFLENLHDGLLFSVDVVANQNGILESDLVLQKQEVPEAFEKARLFTLRLIDLITSAVQRAVNRHELADSTDPRTITDSYFFTYYGVESAIRTSLNIWNDRNYEEYIRNYIEMLRKEYAP